MISVVAVWLSRDLRNPRYGKSNAEAEQMFLAVSSFIITFQLSFGMCISAATIAG